MHSKLMLLKYPKYLRIVVPTGNLVPYDWGETGVMENVSLPRPRRCSIADLLARQMVFLIDLPRINDPARVAANALTHFGAELQFFLEHQGVDGKMVNSLRNYVRVDSDLPPYLPAVPSRPAEPEASSPLPRLVLSCAPSRGGFPLKKPCAALPSHSRQRT